MDTKSDVEVRTQWCETLSTFHDVSCELETELQDRHELGLSEFEVLQRLNGHCGQGERKVKMKELEAEMHLSQSALSRTITRLEKAGLVGRDACEFDRRAMYLQLTDAGRERWAAAAPTHLAVLRKHLT